MKQIIFKLFFENILCNAGVQESTFCEQGQKESEPTGANNIDNKVQEIAKESEIGNERNNSTTQLGNDYTSFAILLLFSTV